MQHDTIQSKLVSFEVIMAISLSKKLEIRGRAKEKSGYPHESEGMRDQRFF